jgi:hypothetical protein
MDCKKTGCFGPHDGALEILPDYTRNETLSVGVSREGVRAQTAIAARSASSSQLWPGNIAHARSSYRAARPGRFPFARSKLSRAGWAGPKAGENTSWRFPNAPWRIVRPAQLQPEMRCGRLHTQRSGAGRHLGRTAAELRADGKLKRRRRQVFRVRHGCGPPAQQKTREGQTAAQGRRAANDTLFPRGCLAILH